MVDAIRVTVGHAVLEEPPVVEDQTVEAPCSSVTTSRAELRASREAEDANRVGALLCALSDPEAFLSVVQRMLGDAQTSQREHDVRSRTATASAMGELRTIELRASAEDARQAKEAGLIGDVLKGIAAGLAAIVGVLGAVFTGGASVVAAVGLIIAIAGPLVCDALAQAEVLPQDVAAGIGIGCAVVGSALSFGAASGSAAATATSTAAKVAIEATKTTLKAVQATLTAAESVARTVQTVETRDSLANSADATEAGAARDEASELADDAVRDVATLLRMLARVGERLREVKEARAAMGDVLVQGFAARA